MKNYKKIEKLKELKKEINNYSIDYEDALYQLRDLDDEGYYSEDFIAYDEAEELTKKQLEDGGLARLNCFIDGVDLTADIFKLDGYGNLENCYKNDLIDAIDEMIENEEEDR